MADKLLIIMMNSDPERGEGLGDPFFQATVAAAMEYDVEVVFTGLAGKLAMKGVAERVVLKAGGERTAYTAIQEAHAAGVKFKVCTAALEQWGHDLIPEIEETVGGAYVISEAMDEGTVTFTY